MKRLLRSKSITSLIVAVVLLLVTSLFPATKPTPSTKSAPLINGVYDVSRVVDGDTLILRDERGVETRLRVIGVDTPETVKPNTPVQPFGKEATAYTKRLISGSRSRVRVELDGPTTDKFQRALAHIYVNVKGDKTSGETNSEREVLLSEEILRNGLGKAMLNFPFSDEMKTRLRAAEAEAKEQKRNLWSGGASGAK